MSLGKTSDHSEYFNRCRNECLNKIASQTNKLIIRLDKLINRQSPEDLSRKDFEKSVVPWSDNSESSNCRSCNAKFSLTKRKHHCRLCGKIMCNGCSQFLTFTSARKLTCPEFANNSFNESYQNQASFNDKRVAMSKISTESLNFMRNKIGSIIGNGVSQDPNLPIIRAEESEEQLRICDMCKNLLDRREEAMDLRTAHSVFVDVYQKLWTLLTQINNLAPSYRHMAESLSKGESNFTLDAATGLRNRLVSIQREITSLSERIEQWGLTDNDPLVTKRPNARETILQRNVKILAINSLHDAISTMSELPSSEQYEILKAEYKEQLVRRMEREKEQKAQASVPSLRSFPSNPMLSSFMRDKHSSSPESFTDESRKLKPSTSLTVLKNEDGWVSNSPIQRNPFAEDENEDLDAVQLQYLNVKSYLQQAAEAGRLEEVEILEKSLADLESEMKKMQLPTPRAIS
ncbi:FYVE zinc finger domain-containing protein [Ditylenchus destructor]|uniref:FYVE zinc finger domain-containing protein n=1 Tax=Ditylenchus destructor TaxID=166010 RepID=A0AAD4NGE9_9BILA|nr:FYVE zinc finger domain-containing protein [Ditylenchus destructor]